MDYYQKYLKYKTKYLELKNGGFRTNLPLTQEGIKVYDEQYKSEETHVRMALNELKNAVPKVTDDLECCLNDFIRSREELLALKTHCDANNLRFADYYTVSNVPVEKQSDVLNRMFKFFDIVIPKLEQTVQSLRFEVHTSISERTNNIPMKTVYEYYRRNYGVSVNIIFEKCVKLIEEITKELHQNQIPYMTLMIQDRGTCKECTAQCDPQIKTDCLFMTMIQKLPRIIMPLEEANKVLKSKPEWNEQALSLDIVIKRLKDLSKMTNTYRSELETLNQQVVIDKTLPNIVVSMKSLDVVFNDIKCDTCNMKSNKKLCCEKPCQMKFTQCVYPKK